MGRPASLEARQNLTTQRRILIQNKDSPFIDEISLDAVYMLASSPARPMPTLTNSAIQVTSTLSTSSLDVWILGLEEWNSVSIANALLYPALFQDE